MCQNLGMSTFAWDPEKTEILTSQRSISFERVVLQIEGDGFLDVVDHPNRERFSHQKMFITEIDSYAFLVPFVESEEHIFLKTIIPSRKAPRKYLDNSGAKH